MPVVINEFEVVTEPRRPAAAEQPAADQQGAPAAPAAEIDRHLQKACERARRVRAH